MGVARFLTALVAVSVLASGCGGDKQSKADRAAMNAEFAKIDFHIAQTTMGPGYAKEKLLEQATRRYAATIHKYRDELGDGEANRRLSHEAEQVGAVLPALCGNPPPRGGSELKRLAALLVIAVVAAGCGEKRHHQTAAERAKMENEFGRTPGEHRRGDQGSGPADEPTMEGYTNDYVALTRKYADDLGGDEVKTKLTDEVSQVQPWCLVCGQILLPREREVLRRARGHNLRRRDQGRTRDGDHGRDTDPGGDRARARRAGQGHPRRRRERRHDQEALRLDRRRVDRGQPARIPRAALHHRGRRGVHQRRDPLRRDDPPVRVGRDAVPEAARARGSSPGSRSTWARSRSPARPARPSPRGSTGCASGSRSTTSSARASRSGAR